MGVNDKFDGRSHLVFHGDIGEFRHADDINAVILEVAGCQPKSFHSLVDHSRINHLYLGVLMFRNLSPYCKEARAGAGGEMVR